MILLLMLICLLSSGAVLVLEWGRMGRAGKAILFFQLGLYLLVFVSWFGISF